MAHELKTPMTSILGFSDLALARPESVQARARALDLCDRTPAAWDVSSTISGIPSAVGLFLCREIARVHGGTLVAMSPTGGPADVGPRSPRVSRVMSNDAVLIIDDDADLRDLVRLVVEAPDVDVVEAATCAEGIAALRANHDRVRLVLLDYFMPGMDPTSCSRELCRLAGSTMIVLCTAAVDPARRAAEIGLSRWLAKPFQLDALESLVREAARQHREPPPEWPADTGGA